jgi:hypothetical protein
MRGLQRCYCRNSMRMFVGGCRFQSFLGCHPKWWVFLIKLSVFFQSDLIIFLCPNNPEESNVLFKKHPMRDLAGQRALSPSLAY